jgi:uncharacterized membrane protein HdeD (DUF308 family)
MKFFQNIKKFRWGILFLSIILCSIGICFIIYPKQSTKIASYLIGGIALCASIIQIIKILANKKRGFTFAFSLIVVIATFICAGVAFIFADVTMQFYPPIIGLIIIIDASFKLQVIVNAKRYNFKSWWFLLIFACLTILGGFLLIRTQHSEENTVLYIFILGISILLCGLQNLFSLFYQGKIEKTAISNIKSQPSISSEEFVVADSSSESNPPSNDDNQS